MVAGDRPHYKDLSWRNGNPTSFVEAPGSFGSRDCACTGEFGYSGLSVHHRQLACGVLEMGCCSAHCYIRRVYYTRNRVLNECCKWQLGTPPNPPTLL